MYYCRCLYCRKLFRAKLESQNCCGEEECREKQKIRNIQLIKERNLEAIAREKERLAKGAKLKTHSYHNWGDMTDGWTYNHDGYCMFCNLLTRLNRFEVCQRCYERRDQAEFATGY
jgi:hypothetical protein